MERMGPDSVSVLVPVAPEADLFLFFHLSVDSLSHHTQLLA